MGIDHYWAAAQEAAETAEEAVLRRGFAAGFALALQLHDARVAQGMTQKQLAGLTGIPQADISRVERGAANPTETNLERLAAALTVSAASSWPTRNISVTRLASACAGSSCATAVKLRA